MLLTTDQLLTIAPKAKRSDVEKYIAKLNEYMPMYEITTPARICPFLANLAEESANFARTLEYADGKAYEGRKDLGNNTPGDGPRFRGRGLMEITGRSMYIYCSRRLLNNTSLLDHPELLEEPDLAVKSACWFWKEVKGLNAIADKPNDWTHAYKDKVYSRFEWIVLLINGGQNGIAERKALYGRAQAIIT